MNIDEVTFALVDALESVQCDYMLVGAIAAIHHGITRSTFDVDAVADATKVYVYRNQGSQKLVANYNVDEIRKGRKRDPRVYGGDVIVVFPSQSKVALKNLKEALGVATSATGLAIP